MQAVSLFHLKARSIYNGDQQQVRQVNWNTKKQLDLRLKRPILTNRKNKENTTGKVKSNG